MNYILIAIILIATEYYIDIIDEKVQIQIERKEFSWPSYQWAFCQAASLHPLLKMVFFLT